MLKIHLYLLFLVLNALLVGFVLWRYRKNLGIHRERIFDFVFVYVIVSILFGRFIYVIQNWSEFGNLSWSICPFYFLPGAERVWFIQMPYALIKFWDQGVDYSGILFGGVFITFFFYITKRFGKKNLWHVIKGLCLGQIIQLIGYLYEGVYYGKKTNLIFGIKYTGVDDVTRFPLQLLEIAVLLVFLAILPTLKRKDKSLSVGIYLFIFGWLEIFVYFLKERISSEGIGVGLVQILYLVFVFIGIFITVFSLQQSKPVPVSEQGVDFVPTATRESRILPSDKRSVARTYQESFSSYRKPQSKFLSWVRRKISRKVRGTG
ncbi:MAG: prolipoprotein diacylglyceryl transferase family protein [Patescibacteria group bacterium]|nr:hypothetical protein [Patescibacteria group bacterium]